MIHDSDQDVARIVARQAGTLLNGILANARSIPESNNHTIDELARKQLGKQGDRAAHELLVALLAKSRPDDAVLSEEGVHDSARNDVDRLWIVDPLDGTSHFSSGDSGFAVHIALWERTSAAPSQISAASVYVPATEVMLSMDDVATLAHVDHDDIRILVSKSRPPQELAAIEETLRGHFGKAVTVISMGSVGAKMAHIIAGHADMYINTGGMHEWDLAAPLGVAHHYGLSVCDRAGQSIALNNVETFIPSVIISRPEFVDVLTSCLA